jgi:hypothetical protein
MHSMPLSWIESLAHLEHVMGLCWCLWVDTHQNFNEYVVAAGDEGCDEINIKESQNY